MDPLRPAHHGGLLKRAAAILPLLALLLAATPGSCDDDAIVVHPSVAEAGVDVETLRDVFLGRRVAWSNGQRIVVVLLKEGASSDHLSATLDKTPQQLLNWWKRLVFTGDGLMPVVVSSERELVQRVAATPGAIAWVSRGSLGDGIRVLPLRR